MKIPSPGSSLEAWEEVDDSSEEEERKDAGSTDVSWLNDTFGTVVLSMLGIKLVHEAAHRVIAWRDKVSTMPLDDCLTRRGFDSRIPT